MTTPAGELRAAAQQLRAAATVAQDDLETADYWKPYTPAAAWRDGHVNGFGGVSSEYVALLPPTVGLALADWLDTAVEDAETIGPDPQALVVARAILGQQPRDTGQAPAGPDPDLNVELGLATFKGTGGSVELGPDSLKTTEPQPTTPDGLRVLYAEAITRDWHLDQQVVDEITAAVLAVRDRKMQQLRHRVAQAEELQRIAHDTSNKSETERARAVQRAEQAESRLLSTRNAAALHRKQLITTAELYAVIEAMPEPGPAATEATEATACRACRAHAAGLHNAHSALTCHCPADDPCDMCPTTPAPAADWTPPPPGDTREQMPPHILTLIRPYLRGYTSTACQTAGYLAEAIADHPEHRAELIEWRQRMDARCRTNQKYTGEICPHHTKEPTP